MDYKPKNSLEKFGLKVYNLLVENFPQTFFVGGLVRDTFTGREVKDVDIATEARPDQVIEILKKSGIAYSAAGLKFGTISAKKGKLSLEITTLRTEAYSHSRYPQVTFIKDLKKDSKRRDFTINSLYLSPKLNKILDFHKGLKDLELKQLKFIGNPERRIKEDPLRIARALRFAITLNLKIEKESFAAIKKHFSLTQSLSNSKILNEAGKIKNKKERNIFLLALDGSKNLDKYEKKL